MIIHKKLAAGHWNDFSLVEQLANVGCDVDRAIRWRNEGKKELSNQAFERVLELLDLTVTDPKNKKKGTLKEVLRVREFFIDYFLFDNQYSFTDKAWQDYFFNFNYMAALRKGK